MDVVVERCAGLDVHKDTVVACVRTPGKGGSREQTTRTFKTMTADLLALRDWLAALGVTLVGMESTGVYWKPVFYVLEDDCASVSEERSAARIVDTAIESFGRLDIVVNNAGIHDPGLFSDLSIEQFQRMIEVHYLGTLFVIRSAWPHLVRAGYGRVVNTVSEAMLGGVAELSSYGAAKGAVFGLTRNLATEGPEHGIRVNAIAPRAYTRLSAAHTEQMAAERSIPKEMMDKINASMTPDLVAPAAAFLAHESCPLNGEVLQAGLGGVARIAVLCSRGISKRKLTPEDIADNLDTIMDMDGGQVRSAVDQSG